MFKINPSDKITIECTVTDTCTDYTQGVWAKTKYSAPFRATHDIIKSVKSTVKVGDRVKWKLGDPGEVIYERDGKFLVVWDLPKFTSISWLEPNELERV